MITWQDQILSHLTFRLSYILSVIFHAQDELFLDLCPGDKQSRSVPSSPCPWGIPQGQALHRLLLTSPIYPDNKTTTCCLSLPFSSVTAHTSLFFLSKYLDFFCQGWNLCRGAFTMQSPEQNPARDAFLPAHWMQRMDQQGWAAPSLTQNHLLPCTMNHRALEVTALEYLLVLHTTDKTEMRQETGLDAEQHFSCGEFRASDWFHSFYFSIFLFFFLLVTF